MMLAYCQKKILFRTWTTTHLRGMDAERLYPHRSTTVMAEAAIWQNRHFTWKQDPTTVRAG